MEWFNIWGLVIVCGLMIPNVIFALRQKGSFESNYRNKWIELAEQMGRLGCIAFMIFPIPHRELGWSSEQAFIIYLLVDAMGLALYYAIWLLCRDKHNRFKALSLSMIPSTIFLFSGVMCGSLGLIVSAVIFATTHIWISYKNADCL